MAVVLFCSKSFEHCSDNEQASIENIKYELVCRKWININPSMEFRCFIAKNIIIGICQRDVRSYYEHLKKEKEDIIMDILDFFNRKIVHKFPLEKCNSSFYLKKE